MTRNTHSGTQNFRKWRWVGAGSVLILLLGLMWTSGVKAADSRREQVLNASQKTTAHAVVLAVGKHLASGGEVPDSPQVVTDGWFTIGDQPPVMIGQDGPPYNTTMTLFVKGNGSSMCALVHMDGLSDVAIESRRSGDTFEWSAPSPSCAPEFTEESR